MSFENFFFHSTSHQTYNYFFFNLWCFLSIPLVFLLLAIHSLLKNKCQSWAWCPLSLRCMSACCLCQNQLCGCWKNSQWCLPPAGTKHSYNSDGVNAGVSREIHPKMSITAGQAAPSFSVLCDRVSWWKFLEGQLLCCAVVKWQWHLLKGMLRMHLGAARAAQGCLLGGQAFPPCAAWPQLLGKT